MKSVGELETVGHPNLYGTTFDFLHYFGLTSLEQLPPLPEEMVPFLPALTNPASANEVEEKETEPQNEQVVAVMEIGKPAMTEIELVTIPQDAPAGFRSICREGRFIRMSTTRFIQSFFSLNPTRTLGDIIMPLCPPCPDALVMVKAALKR